MELGKVPLLDTMNKIPGGIMLVPLFIGVLFNTFAPAALDIGSFTTALYRQGALTLIAVLFVVVRKSTYGLLEQVSHWGHPQPLPVQYRYK